MRKQTAGILAAAVVACTSAMPVLAATTYTWDGESSALWNVANNWTANSGSPVSGDTAVFSTVGGVDSTIDMNGTQSVNTIVFDAANTKKFTLGTAVNTGAINLDAGGTIKSEVTSVSTTRNGIINAALVLGGNATFSSTNAAGGGNANQAALIFNGGISGAGTITISGASTNAVTFAGNNAGFTGNIIINDGRVALSNASAVSSSNTITMNGGVLAWGAATTTNYVIAGNATGTYLGSTTQSGTLAVSNGVTFSLGTGGGNSGTLAATLQGQGNFNATQGQLTLTGTASNTLSGLFTFSPSLGTDARNTLNLSKTGGAIAIAGHH
jgi:fibronectin-binding autotransporter adhesin